MSFLQDINNSELITINKQANKPYLMKVLVPNNIFVLIFTISNSRKLRADNTIIVCKFLIIFNAKKVNIFFKHILKRCVFESAARKISLDQIIKIILFYNRYSIIFDNISFRII